jgi:hypothetical protein
MNERVVLTEVEVMTEVGWATEDQRLEMRRGEGNASEAMAKEEDAKYREKGLMENMERQE